MFFSHVEGWSFREGFYFAFITLSTIGFGDYVVGENGIIGLSWWAPTRGDEHRGTSYLRLVTSAAAVNFWWPPQKSLV
jgi:hypothetical protein